MWLSFIRNNEVITYNNKQYIITSIGIGATVELNSSNYIYDNIKTFINDEINEIDQELWNEEIELISK